MPFLQAAQPAAASVPTATSNSQASIVGLWHVFLTSGGLPFDEGYDAWHSDGTEILVDNASYPTPRITENSHKFRPLGLGYANLGALLMSMALPYDSDAGRDVCGAVTALMTGEGYAQSARIASMGENSTSGV